MRCYKPEAAREYVMSKSKTTVISTAMRSSREPAHDSDGCDLWWLSARRVGWDVQRNGDRLIDQSKMAERRKLAQTTKP